MHTVIIKHRDTTKCWSYLCVGPWKQAFGGRISSLTLGGQHILSESFASGAPPSRRNLSLGLYKIMQMHIAGPRLRSACYTNCGLQGRQHRHCL